MVKLTIGNATRDYATDFYTHVDTVGSQVYSNGSSFEALFSYTDTTFYDATIFSLTSERRTLFFGRAVGIPGPTSGFVADALLVGSVEGKPVTSFMLDWVHAHGNPDELAARLFQGNDVIQAGRYAATLEGYAGNDRITGGAGDDTIIGDAGRDVLTGGAGADRFVYSGAADLVAGRAEIITDFSHAQGDLIDLSGFDADATTEGLQSLTFIGDAAFQAGGSDFEVRVSARVAGVNLLQFDFDHDGVTDVAISVRTSTLLTAADLGLAGTGDESSSAAVFGEDARAVAGVTHPGPSLHDLSLMHLV